MSVAQKLKIKGRRISKKIDAGTKVLRRRLILKYINANPSHRNKLGSTECQAVIRAVPGKIASMFSGTTYASCGER